MTANFRMRLTSFSSLEEAQSFFSRLGATLSGTAIMAPKAIFKAVLIENLDNRAVNILKQEMLSLGGEAVTKETVTRFQLGTSDTVLLGTLKHFSFLQKKLAAQPFGLKKVGEKLNECLKNFTKRDFSFSVGRYQLDLSKRPLIMGILNITPDSFSDGGKFLQKEAAISHARQLIAQGADLIDIGGESSRPGAALVSLEEEKRRVWPIIEDISSLNIPISVDTYKAEVAAGALERGAVIVNDISALNFDQEMAEVVAKHQAGLVLMHIQGTPQDMQQNPAYQNLLGEIIDYWQASIERAEQAWIDKSKIILDPGIGFGKTLSHNLEILKRFEEFRSLGQPLMIGTSRKSFIGAVSGKPVSERLWGTLATLVWAVERGANIIRVHDVAAAKEVLQMTKALEAGGEFSLGE